MPARARCRVEHPLPGLAVVTADGAPGIGQSGYLLRTPAGNIAFEGAAWYDDDALDAIAALGGVRWIAASHPHVYGALWRVAERFGADVVLQRDDLPFAQALPVAWAFDDAAGLTPGVRLLHTGGHTPGHTVLHWDDAAHGRRLLFCGDGFKYTLDADGRANSVSTHKAFDADIPLTHRELRGYAEVLADLEADVVVTPWEVVHGNGLAAARTLLALQATSSHPFTDRVLVDGDGRPTGERVPERAWRARHGAGRVVAPTAAGPDVTDVTDEPADAAAATTSTAALARAADVYRAIVPDGLPRHEFPLHGLDRLGVPVYYAVCTTPDGAFLSGVGYGDTDLAARTSALGEMAETFGAWASFRRLPRREASYAQLVGAGVPALDPLRCRLPVDTDYTPDRPVRWVEAVRWPDGARQLVPLEYAASNVGDTGPGDWLFTPITNGMGAGDTLERALAHGVLELVQRDGNSLAYRALDQGVALDLEGVTDAVSRALLARLDAAGVGVVAKLAATSFGMANVYVVGAEREPARAPHPIMLTACGEAAHPDRERALRKALLEFCSSRTRKRFAHGALDIVGPLLPPGYRDALLATPPGWDDEARALGAMRALTAEDPDGVMAMLADRVLAVRTRVPFAALPTVPAGALDDPAALLADVTARLAAAGLDLWWVDLTPAGARARVVKVLVPALEVEGMSYHRIGRRGVARLLARGDALVGRIADGAPPAGARRVPLPADDEAALGGPVWFDVAEAERRLGTLYALYREPGEHVLAFADAAPVAVPA
jgi:ribosomal protein S12 methylthiotransferase accessory factor